ncbi:MAG: hypothetical protein R3F23_07730 [Verrucomicrobiia bacterium]
MARVRRYGYILEWYIGDHVPRHVHVYFKGRLLGRFDVDRMQPIENWKADKKLIKLIEELKLEERL